MSQKVTLKNIFPKPSEVCQESNDEIKEIIRQQFKEKGKLDFHDMLKFFDEQVELKNYKKALICAFYCTNALLGNQSITGDDKAEVILSLKARVDILQGKSPYDINISGGPE